LASIIRIYYDARSPECQILLILPVLSYRPYRTLLLIYNTRTVTFGSVYKLKCQTLQWFWWKQRRTYVEGGYSGIFKFNILILIRKVTDLFPDGVTGIYLW